MAEQSASGSGVSGDKEVIDLGNEDDDDTEEESSPNKRVTKWFRPTNNWSLIWKHMKHDEKKTVIKCDLCPKTFKFNTGGTSTVRRHLANKHKLSLVEEPISQKNTKETHQLSIAGLLTRDEFLHVS